MERLLSRPVCGLQGEDRGLCPVPSYNTLMCELHSVLSHPWRKQASLALYLDGNAPNCMHLTEAPANRESQAFCKKAASRSVRHKPGLHALCT